MTFCHLRIFARTSSMQSNSARNECRHWIPESTKASYRMWNRPPHSPLPGLLDAYLLVGTSRGGPARRRSLAEPERGGLAEHDAFCQTAMRLAAGTLDRQECPGTLLEDPSRSTGSREHRNTPGAIGCPGSFFPGQTSGRRDLTQPSRRNRGVRRHEFEWSAGL